MTKASKIQSGEIVGDRYCILYEIGRGRWSQTYLVREREGNRDRGVLKLFTPVLPRGQSSARVVAKFDRAARELARLQHPQIPKLKDFFSTSFRKRECWCCVYESAEGLNFQELLQLRWQHGRRFQEPEVLQLLGQLLPVLVYLHENGATHGDLAPENIMLRQTDQVPMLIDFGALKQIAAESGFYAGIPGYAPPEQVRDGTVLTQSDIYALGMTAIALLSGREPQQWAGDWSQVRASPASIDVLKSMLAPEARDRADAKMALAAVRDLLWEEEPVAPEAEVEPLVLPAEESETEPVALEEGKAEKPTASPEDASEVPAPILVFKEPELQPIDAATMQSLEDSLTAAPVSRIGRGKSETEYLEPQARSNGAKMLLKALLVCAFSLSSGTAGWWASRLWIDRNAQSLASEGEVLFAPSKELSFLPADDPEPEPEASLPAAERDRKLALRDRRLRSELNYEYFTALTNEMFWVTYPQQAGRTPSLAPEDSIWRERRDEVAVQLLDRLEFLSASSRQRLGRYTSDERANAVRAAASLNLSEKALFETTEALLDYRFPEATASTKESSAISQIEFAIAADLLRTLGLSPSLAPLSLTPTAPFSSSGMLQPGEVKVFFLRIESGQSISAFLDADLSVRFSVYNARGAPLLENHKLRSWSERVTETGVYTCILISQSPVENAYNFTLTGLDN